MLAILTEAAERETCPTSPVGQGEDASHRCRTIVRWITTLLPLHAEGVEHVANFEQSE
jgi:hypothetical protein